MSDIGIFLLLFACLLIAVGLIRFFSWLTELQEKHGSVTRAGVNTVKRYVVVERPVMSRHDEGAGPYFPQSLQTDGAQTPDQTEIAALRRAKLFDTYRTLRELGMSRDAARAFLKPWNIPVDNNLWADAAPPEDEHRTPIVGRPTNAKFETDADYPYQPIKN